MSKCILCGQRNVDGADNQFGDFVCVDCWALGDAQYAGFKATTLQPVPTVLGRAVNYSGLDFNKILAAYNHEPLTVEAVEAPKQIESEEISNDK